MLDGWIRSGAYGSIAIRPASTSALMSRSESNMAATLAAAAAVLGQSVRRLISSQWSPIDTMEPSLTRTRSPMRHFVDTPPLVVTVDPLVEPRSTRNAPSLSVAMARCDLETVRVSSAILISWASSSPGCAWGFLPSSTKPVMSISRPSSSTTNQPVWPSARADSGTAIEGEIRLRPAASFGAGRSPGGPALAPAGCPSALAPAANAVAPAGGARTPAGGMSGGGGSAGRSAVGGRLDGLGCPDEAGSPLVGGWGGSAGRSAVGGRLYGLGCPDEAGSPLVGGWGGSADRSAVRGRLYGWGSADRPDSAVGAG